MFPVSPASLAEHAALICQPGRVSRRAHPDGGLLRGVPESALRSLWRCAAWTGGISAAAGAVLGSLVAIFCWLPQAGVSGHPTSAIRAGVLAFLAGQHGGLVVDGVRTTFVPMFAVLVVIGLAWRAGTTLAEVAALLGKRARNGVIAAGVLQAACYALACVLLARMAALGTTEARLVPVGVAAFLVFGCVAVTSASRAWFDVRTRLPAHIIAGGRAATGALAVYAGAGAMLVAGSLIVHAGTAMQISRQVGGGLSGLPIAVLGVLYAPNATVAGMAYLAGPGFAVGTGTAVNAFSASHGVLPAFPLLGALPSGHGSSRVVLAWMAITLLAAGCVAARLARCAETLRAVAVAASLSGAAMAVLAWLGGGAVGTGRLRTVGASPWQTGLAVAGAIAASALVAVAARAIWMWLARWARGTAGADDHAHGRGDEPELTSIGSSDAG